MADKAGEISRGEKIAVRGADPDSYITEYTLEYEDKTCVACVDTTPIVGGRDGQGPTDLDKTRTNSDTTLSWSV